ncbi:MAG: YqeG family HAD IIIA-type phosphatase [Culicoidibacterales bacterium]
MLKQFKADTEYMYYSELTVARLKKQGITMIFSDLDNTLVADGAIEAPKQLVEWLTELSENNIKIIIVSNNKSEKRVKEFAQPLGLEYYYKAGKPNPRIYQTILEKHNQLPEETLMLGDRLTTDIYGGNKMGMYTVLVNPIDANEPMGIRFMRGVEWFLKIMVK